MGLVALSGREYHLSNGKSLLSDTVAEGLCVICTSAVALIMTNRHDRGGVWFPHLRANCDGWRFQRSPLLDKLVHSNLIGKEPLDAGEAKSKEADAKQGEEEGHLKNVEEVNHGTPLSVFVEPTNVLFQAVCS